MSCQNGIEQFIYLFTTCDLCNRVISVDSHVSVTLEASSLRAAYVTDNLEIHGRHRRHQKQWRGPPIVADFKNLGHQPYPTT